MFNDSLTLIFIIFDEFLQECFELALLSVVHNVITFYWCSLLRGRLIAALLGICRVYLYESCLPHLELFKSVDPLKEAKCHKL